MTMIARLSAAQKARFPEFVEKWTKIGLSTAPADRPRAEKAIHGLYRLAKLAAPKIIWLPCPISGVASAMTFAGIVGQHCRDDPAVDSAVGSAVDSAVYLAVGSAVYSAVGSAVSSAVGSAVYSAVSSAVSSAVGSAVRSAVGSAVSSAVDSAVDSAGRSFIGGSLWPAYAAWSDFFNIVLGIGINRDYLDMIESCGYFWILRGVCFASERPSEINRDAGGRLHSETGMAIRYRSGWGLYAWRGVVIPSDWIVDKTRLTPKIALTQKNAEQRRAACEIIGWDKLLSAMNARLLDRDPEPTMGELYEVDHPAVGGRARFLRMYCPTGRWFCEPVPPDVKTALEANAWGWNLPKEIYKPSIQA